MDFEKLKKTLDSLEKSKRFVDEKPRLISKRDDEDRKLTLKRLGQISKNHKWARKNVVAKECQNCGSTKELERHHLEYVDDSKAIVVLCRKCHALLHWKQKKEMKTK